MTKHADSVTAEEKATVWREFRNLRDARHVYAGDRYPASAWRQIVGYGVFDLREVALVAEWMSYREEHWHEAVAMAAMWPFPLPPDRPDDALVTASLAAFSKVPVQSGQEAGLARARTALGLMLDYLAEDQGEGVQHLYDFLGYVLREG
jgi:hypothetical protein